MAFGETAALTTPGGAALTDTPVDTAGNTTRPVSSWTIPAVRRFSTLACPPILRVCSGRPGNQSTKRVSILDPISLEDVTELDSAPSVIEGEGKNAIKIYFQTEQNRREYLEMEVHGSSNSAGLKKIFDDAADSPITGTIN